MVPCHLWYQSGYYLRRFGCNNDEALVIGDVDHWVRASLTGLGTARMQQHVGAGEVAADFAFIFSVIV